MVQCATTALAGVVPRLCVRGARGRFRGLGPVPGVVSLLFPPSRPACPALLVAGPAVRVSLTLARSYAIPRGLCIPRARSGCPSGSPRVPFACVCARAPAASTPPPPWVVWRAHLARSRHWALVGPFHVVHAPLRVLPRSLALSGVLWGGAVGSRFPPTWLGAVFVWGVWFQAPSLPRLPVLWGGRAGVPRPVCSGCGRCWRGDPAPVQKAGRRCSLWGWRKGVPRGGAFHLCDGRLRSGAPPPRTARPLGGLLRSATHVLWARVCGCGGPTLSPWPACPLGAACRGGGGGPSPGGLACHRWEGRLVSGAVPPPVARPLGQAAGVPRPLCSGCGRCGRGDPAPAPQRAGVACCGGGGRASPGGGAFHRCEGRLRSGAPPPPTARPLGLQ